MFIKDEENVKHLVKRKNDFGFNSKLNAERCMKKHKFGW